MSSTTLTFDESAADFILESFGREVDEDGFVYDPESGEYETIDENGERLNVEHFAGVEDGSIIFLDDDFTTLVEHVKRRREE